MTQSILTSEQSDELIKTLNERFQNNPQRHKGIIWEDIEKRLRSQPDKLFSVFEMERTGGEPDVVGYDADKKQFLIVDCAKESPDGRRSLCYDQESLDSRKEAKPANSAVGLAAEMGIELLDEEQYRSLQELGEFDLKTSSWIKTTSSVRKLGGALFADRRYDRVFVYHNGAQSYYSGRGFRGILYL